MLSVTLAKRTDPGKTIASDEDGNNRAAGGVSFFAWPRTNMKGRGFALLHSRSCGHGKNTRNNVDQKSEVGRKFSVIVFRVPVVRDAVHAKLRFSFARCAAVVPPVSRSFSCFLAFFHVFTFSCFFFLQLSCFSIYSAAMRLRGFGLHFPTTFSAIWLVSFVHLFGIPRFVF